MVCLQVREDARSGGGRRRCLDYRLRDWLATRVGSRLASSSWINGRSWRPNVLNAEQLGIGDEAPSRNRSSSVASRAGGQCRAVRLCGNHTRVCGEPGDRRKRTGQGVWRREELPGAIRGAESRELFSPFCILGGLCVPAEIFVRLAEHHLPTIIAKCTQRSDWINLDR